MNVSPFVFLLLSDLLLNGYVYSYIQFIIVECVGLACRFMPLWLCAKSAPIVIVSHSINRRVFIYTLLHACSFNNKKMEARNILTKLSVFGHFPLSRYKNTICNDNVTLSDFEITLMMIHIYNTYVYNNLRICTIIMSSYSLAQ